MTNSKPGLWSSLIGAVFIASGGYIFLFQDTYPSLGLPLILFGVFITGVGWYVHLVRTPASLALGDDETLLEKRHPTQKVAVGKLLTSIPVLGLAGYLFLGTTVPYVYPSVAFLAGLYFLSSGILTYWANCLSVYYITDQRVISEYHFLSLRRTEVPLHQVRGVQERRSPTEALVGVGNVQVSSGESGPLKITIRSIDDSTAFAEKVRSLI